MEYSFDITKLTKAVEHEDWVIAMKVENIWLAQEVAYRLEEYDGEIDKETFDDLMSRFMQALYIQEDETHGDIFHSCMEEAGLV